MAAVVLMVNHRTESCGVYQYGKRLFSRALRSKRYEVNCIEVDSKWEFEHWVNQLNPQIIMYNYYPSTMPWLDEGVIRQHRPRKQLCLFHEAPVHHLGFDLVVHQEPNNPIEGFINISRHIPEYTPYLPVPEVPTFGSFGFGLGGKGFDKLVDKVSAEYERAIVRLHIPYAAFGDSDGHGARAWVSACRQRIHPGIELDADHGFISEISLLDWLSQNTINCFFYDENYGRGISGTADYALASGRPLAITRSWQFKHLWEVEPRVLIEGRTLQEMIDQGTKHLEVFKKMWGGTRVTDDFERIFDQVMA
jgi:hypothetical protein